MSIFVGQDQPVLFDFFDESVKELTKATLQYSNSTTIMQAVPMSCAEADCDINSTKYIWSVIFDPRHFRANQTYQILWEGVDINDAPFSHLETGITITYETDFYHGMVKRLRQSILDDGVSCDYHPRMMLEALDYATCIVNSTPPLIEVRPECIPCNLLIDFAKANLYMSRAGREAIETFTYNDIGKSFGFDISGKLLQLAQFLQKNARDYLILWKRHLRPQMMGLMSRYARRSGRTARAMFIERAVYRSFIR